MASLLFPSPGYEGAFSIDEVNFFLLKLDNVCSSGAVVEVLEELLQGIFRALSFPFNLASSAPETAGASQQWISAHLVVWCVLDEARQAVALGFGLSE